MPTLKVATHDGARLDCGACVRTATLLTWHPSHFLDSLPRGGEVWSRSSSIVLLRTLFAELLPLQLCPRLIRNCCTVGLELWHFNCFLCRLFAKASGTTGLNMRFSSDLCAVLKFGWIAPAPRPCWITGLNTWYVVRRVLFETTQGESDGINHEGQTREQPDDD